MHYVQLLNIEAEYSDQFLFFVCDLSACNVGHKIRPDRKALSKTKLRELFKSALKPHVSDISKYGF